MAGIPKQQPRKERASNAAALHAERDGGPAYAAATPNAVASQAEDALFMRRAIALAQRGAGWTNPNPLVGCVIARDGRVIGEGCHERYGCAHAERNALADCAQRAAQNSEENALSTPVSSADPAHGCARGATAYVTLEPCCHTGKQPPCTEALIAAGVARVAVGSRDPNPLVAGKGVQALRAADIQVDTDVLRGECDQLNPVFFHFITTGLPYVVAKWAMSADGKIACASSDAHWVTGPEARADSHELRHRLAAICVGIGTVLADNPLLTCRRKGAQSSQPVRVVLDSHLRIPEGCALVRSCAAGEAPLLIATCANTEDPASTVHDKAERLRAYGADVLRAPTSASGHVALRPLLRELGERGIDSLLVEGGSRIHGAFFDEGLVDEAVAYIAPKVVGGAAAPSPVGGTGAARMSDAVALGRATSSVLGSDVKLTFAPENAACVAAQTPASLQGGASCSPAL